MMHSKETKTVVTICDSNKKPLREHSVNSSPNRRSSKVYIPFDSEYQFLIKNGDERRLRVSIDIDGSSIGDDLIINGKQSVFLERFISHATKFKFVSLENESVADPTSYENGMISVKVYLEKQIKITPEMVKELMCLTGNSSIDCKTALKDCYGDMNKAIKYLNSLLTYRGGTTPLYSKDFSTPDNCVQYSATVNGSSSYGYWSTSDFNDNGATIDGSFSNQLFRAVSWNGDSEDCFEFIFNMKGLKISFSEEEKKEMELLEKLKLKYESVDTSKYR